MIKGIHHIAIDAKDFDKSCDFYRDCLGLKQVLAWTTSSGVRVVMLDGGNGCCVELFERPSYDSPHEGNYGGLCHLAFQVTDCAGMLEKARAWGAEVTKEPVELTLGSEKKGNVRIAFCQGPDGESVEFYQEL